MPIRAKSREHPGTTTAPGESVPGASQRPDFFRLPKAKSGGDPYFHFSRSFYFQGETRGYWKMGGGQPSVAGKSEQQQQKKEQQKNSSFVRHVMTKGNGHETAT
jgi:hypothetical protein